MQENENTWQKYFFFFFLGPLSIGKPFIGHQTLESSIGHRINVFLLLFLKRVDFNHLGFYFSKIISDFNIWKYVPTIFLGRRRIVNLNNWCKRENTLNDNDTFEGLKVSMGKFSKLEILEKISSFVSSFITQFIFYLGAKFRI